MSCDIVGLTRHHQVHVSFNWTAGNLGGGGGGVLLPSFCVVVVLAFLYPTLPLGYHVMMLAN